jgi:hypothetical protein
LNVTTKISRTFDAPSLNARGPHREHPGLLARGLKQRGAAADAEVVRFRRDQRDAVGRLRGDYP